MTATRPLPDWSLLDRLMMKTHADDASSQEGSSHRHTIQRIALVFYRSPQETT